MIRIFIVMFLSASMAVGQDDKSEALFDKGFEAYEESDYTSAISYYTQAIELAPKASYYYHRGVCYSLNGDNGKAIKDFDVAIEINEAYGDAYFERAYSYYVLEDNANALLNYDKAIELMPDYGPAYLNRGSVKYDMDNLDGACVDWKKAVILDIEIAKELLTEYCPSKT